MVAGTYITILSWKETMKVLTDSTKYQGIDLDMSLILLCILKFGKPELPRYPSPFHSGFQHSSYFSANLHHPTTKADYRIIYHNTPVGP